MATGGPMNPGYPELSEPFPSGWSTVQSTSQWTVEWGVVAFGAAFAAVTLAGLAVLNYNRNVRYVKVLGVGFVNIITFSALLFWFTTMTTLRIIPQTGVFLWLCDLWTLWLWIGSIVTLYSAMFSRLWRLDVILIQRKPPTTMRLHTLPLVLWMPFLAYCGAISGLRALGPYFVNDTVVLCFLPKRYFYGMFAHVILLVAAVFVLAYRLHRVRTRIYNEYWGMFIATWLFIASIAVYGPLVALNYHYVLWGRAVMTLVFTFSLNAFFWVLFGSTVYNVLFRHDAALREFQDAVNNRRIVEDTRLTEEDSKRKSFMLRLRPPVPLSKNKTSAAPPASSGDSSDPSIEPRTPPTPSILRRDDEHLVLTATIDGAESGDV